MELHGSLVSNLEAAVYSARRHHDKRIYPETLRFWGHLIEHARKELSSRITTDTTAIRRLADELEREIARQQR